MDLIPIVVIIQPVQTVRMIVHNVLRLNGDHGVVVRWVAVLALKCKHAVVQELFLHVLLLVQVQALHAVEQIQDRVALILHLQPLVPSLLYKIIQILICQPE